MGHALRNFLVCGVFAIAMFVLPIRPGIADPAGIHACNEFADWAVANAKQIRTMGGCGLNLSDHTLSTNRSEHVRWCMRQEQEGVAALYDDLFDQTGKCGYCLYYARTIKEFADLNWYYQCNL